jgi:hypothetical protein
MSGKAYHGLQDETLDSEPSHLEDVSPRGGHILDVVDSDVKYPGEHLISFEGDSLQSAKKGFKKQTVVIDGASNQLDESEVQIQNGENDEGDGIDDKHGYFDQRRNIKDEAKSDDSSSSEEEESKAPSPHVDSEEEEDMSTGCKLLHLI